MYQPSNRFEREILDHVMRGLNPAEQDRLQQALDHAFQAEQALADVAKELSVSNEIGETSVAIWWDVWQGELRPTPKPILDLPIDLAAIIKRGLTQSADDYNDSPPPPPLRQIREGEVA